jgi:hypothetical protein
VIVHAKWSALAQGHWYEYVIRFVLGGLTTAVVGLVAQQWGPAVGGLFLAFPAIFCASATLVEKHERERKQSRGLRGARRGREAAALDAAGAALGSAGLAIFAALVWWLAPRSPVTSLAFAATAWLVVVVLLWKLRRMLRLARNERFPLRLKS